MSKKYFFSWSYMKSSLHIIECFSGKHLNLKLKIVRANLPFLDFNVCNNWKGSTYYFYVLIDDFSLEIRLGQNTLSIHFTRFMKVLMHLLIIVQGKSYFTCYISHFENQNQSILVKEKFVQNLSLCISKAS